jgi:hypothetical protein
MICQIPRKGLLGNKSIDLSRGIFSMYMYVYARRVLCDREAMHGTLQELGLALNTFFGIFYAGFLWGFTSNSVL